MVKSPTFKFWKLEKCQHIRFIFIQAHRGKRWDSCLLPCVSLCLCSLLQNTRNCQGDTNLYLRPGMLPDSIQVQFEKGHSTIARSNYLLLPIPIDQIHVQANITVKGVVSMVSLTENPDMLEHWIMTGPDITLASRSSQVGTSIMMIVLIKYDDKMYKSPAAAESVHKVYWTRSVQQLKRACACLKRETSNSNDQTKQLTVVP